MSVDFIDSEICKINSKDFVYFRDPLLLLKSIEATLSRISPKKFFKSADGNIKKVREEMAELFFMLALQKETAKDWFLMQPEDDPPDFILMNVSDKPINIILDKFELVEIHLRCQSFEEMMEVVKRKLDKGYSESYNLLIFINHENSKEWVSLLDTRLENYNPFKAIWTVQLLWNKKDEDLWGSVVNKLRPRPLWHIEAKLEDTKFRYSETIPTFMERVERDNKIFFSFRPSFVKELRIKFRQMKLLSKQI